MSIKKLFESSNKVQDFISQTNAKDAFNSDAESLENVELITEDQRRYVPQVDYSDPDNFAKFGSARLYYKSALARITDYYPYDGSDAEKNKFLNGCIDLERYILKNRYPRTTGYIELGRQYAVSAVTADGYGVPTTNEYIDFYGGPGTGSVTSTRLVDLMPNDKDNKYTYSNIYDEDIYTTAKLPADYGSGTRTSNLKANFDNGVTVEFWLKTGSIDTDVTEKQVIFDWWNNDTSSAQGRITIELTSSNDADGNLQRPFLLTVQSGSHTTKDFISLGSSSVHVGLSDWNHYSIRMYNTGSDFKTQLYVNGQHTDTATKAPYDLATSTFGLLSASATPERAWPYAVEDAYSSATTLQGWWRLNNSSSATFRCDDMSGRSRNGTFDADADFPTIDTSNYPSKYIQATTGSLLFDASVDKINIGTAATWDAIIGNNSAGGSSEKMTFSAWIRPTGDGEGGYGRILDFASQDVAFFVSSESAGAVHLNFTVKFDGALGNWRTTNREVTINQWTHVALTFDATSDANNPIFYVNGVAVAVTETGTPSGNYSGIDGTDCYIGNETTAARTFEGNIADVAIWNSILTINEIQSIYSAHLIKNETLTVNELNPKNAVGRIGALLLGHPAGAGVSGYGRLSGSIDEFRFWKTKRTGKEIGQNWHSQVGGGVNSDISNTTLGVYYKFNEGITGDTTTDAIVLDYAGRVTNGVWTGYAPGSRNTGSAIVSASATTSEFLDPIIRTNHPDYILLESELLESGSAYDYQNNASFLNLMPSWVVQESSETENFDLQYLSHIAGTYFDKLRNQIKDLPKLRHQTHTSGTFKPISFAEHLPQSLGLYSPEIFIDSTVLERFANKNLERTFENDLTEAKNLIYQNLYNNLTEIYKAKGTEKSVRNVLRCFNIDDKLLKLKINSNNTEFILRNNLELNLLNKNCINFNTTANSTAVVYQKSASYGDLIPTIASGSITGSASQYGYGFTHEANIIFPYFNSQAEHRRRLGTVNQMSLFGTVTVDNDSEDSKTGASTTAIAAYKDYGNFKFYSIKENPESRNAYFKLSIYNPWTTSSIDLTSSMFYDVYNNEPWNLSVRVKHINYPLAEHVLVNTGSTLADARHQAISDRYDIIFTGYNAQTTDMFNSFEVSTTVSGSTGRKFIESRKRVFVGADKVNVTGDTNYKSDVLVSSTAYWLKYLENTDLQQHAVDLENVGLSGSIQPLFPTAEAVETLGRNTLALNWNFRNVTGSDSSGNFVVQDFSSGSATKINSYGWLGNISGYQYTGYGTGFEASSTNVVKKQKVNTYRFVDPERPVSSDMVQIFEDIDELTPNLRREEIVPNYVYSLEKSLYEAISQEMLDFFAGAIDFNIAIGEAPNAYRPRYKDLEKLRLERVTKVSTVEKYTDYYKWFDDSITTIISQLMPASSEYANDIQNVVESHVLERNKYQNRLNIIDSNKFDLALPLAMTFGGTEVSEDVVSSEFTSMARSPRPTDEHVGFWKKKADRASPEITSGDATIDSQRNKFKEVIYSSPMASSSFVMPTLVASDGTTYIRSSYNRRRLAGFQKISVQANESNFGDPRFKQTTTRAIKGGVNFDLNKSLEYTYTAVHPAGPINGEDGVLVPENVLLGLLNEAVDIPYVIDTRIPPEKIIKKKKTFKVQHGRDWEDGIGYKNTKSQFSFPFNILSTSVEVNSGYNAEVIENVDRYLQITNVHNDAYGDQLEIPMQGPFTYNVVGGHQSRHIDFNEGTDEQNNRPEAWRILLGTCDVVPSGAIGIVGADYPPPNHVPVGGERPYPFAPHQKAYLYRDFIAKRPVNIKNISQKQNNKTAPGNYDQQYQIVHSFGATSNPRAFVDSQPTLPAQIDGLTNNSTTNVRTILDIHRGEESHFEVVNDYSVDYLDTNTNNKSIIITKFSAPGGIEVMSRGYQDIRAAEFSPYNSIAYRNLTVKKPSQGPSGSISEATGSSPSTMRVNDIHNKDYGLYAHSARHSARFGRDSTLVTSPGSSYVELPAFHKTNRNARQVIVSTNVDNTTFATSSKYDNLNIQHPIPRSDRQYRWLSSSVLDVSDIKYAGFQRTTVNDRLPYRTSSAGLEYYWTFVTGSSAEMENLFQPTNGLNIIINDPISSSTHTIGYDSTVNVSSYTNPYMFDGAPNSNYLNQLLTSRRATYGWGWTKFHQSDNRILIAERKENNLTIATGSDIGLTTFKLPPLSLKGRQSALNFDVKTPARKSLRTDNVSIKFTNTNERIFFNQRSLNEFAEINYENVNQPYKDAIRAANSNNSSLNWFLYTQNIFPSMRNEFGSFASKRVGYDNKFWRNSEAGRRTIGNTLSSSMVGALVSKSAWVLDAPINFLTRTSIYGTSGSYVIPFSDTFWTDTLYQTGTLTGAFGYNMFVPQAGELQNTYFSYFNIGTDGGKFATMQVAPLYARKHVLGTPHSVVSPGGMKIPETGSWGGVSNTGWDLAKQIEPFAGEALWEAPTQAGIVVPGIKPTGSADGKVLTNTLEPVFLASGSNPWYGSYDEFNSDLKLLAKGYAIVPEYRMSEHVKDYYKYGINNKSKNDFFEIVGTNSSSADRNFYIDYSNSDFLENFLGIKRDSLLNAKEIKLTCKAAIKYNPYKGFYPAQRTVDLATQFAESFEDAVQAAFSGSGSGVVAFNNKTFGHDATIYQRAGGVMKLLLDPLVSPGILYNSIKSGIAVDYPIVSNHRKRLRRAYGTNLTASTTNWALSITGSTTVDSYLSGTGEYIGGQFWDKRIPFEAIIEPRKYILNTNFVDMESHPSMSIDWNWSDHRLGPDLVFERQSMTASYSDNSDGVYTMMARNFFGAVGEFFLEGAGITKLESNTVLNDLQFTKDANFASSRPLYMARVKLRKSHNGAREYTKEYDSFGIAGALSYYGVNGAVRTVNGTQSVGQYPLPQDPMRNEIFKETFTMYSRPTAFGPPCAGRPTGSNANTTPFREAARDSFSGFNPAFTPPYYDGEAWADLIFRPHVVDKSDSKTAASETYDLNRILNEVEVVCWRFDPGEPKQADPSATHAPMPVLIPIEQTQFAMFTGSTPSDDKTVPSIYDGKRINANSMQLTSSVQIFGTKRIMGQETDKFGSVIKNTNTPVGSKWVIQPKWETPMLNFNDDGVHRIRASDGTLTLPLYGSASVPRGMWHQFGVIPDDPNKGIFLEITDIPEAWLKNHYEVLAGDRETPYNGNAYGSSLKDEKRANLYKHVRSLSSLCGFDKTNSSVKLGQMKESLAVHEAIVAIPYIIDEIEGSVKDSLPVSSKFRQTRKKFISIPKRRLGSARDQAAGSVQGDSLTAAGASIRKLKQSMEKYVFPPEFDFLHNKEVDPIAMYMFEFKYEFDRDDLSYMWQNLAPRDHEKVTFQEASVSHNLANNELINEEVLNNDNLRWMVFKVKQRTQTDYYDLIPDQANESTRQVEQKDIKLKDYKFGFNWPYDYLSFVELIKMDVDILLKKDE
jgi:hypothetical protein